MTHKTPHDMKQHDIMIRPSLSFKQPTINPLRTFHLAAVLLLLMTGAQNVWGQVTTKLGQPVSGLYNAALSATATSTTAEAVVLNDLEDHKWSYYNDESCPIHSFNPIDVTITYLGNGIVIPDNTEPTSISDDNATSWRISSGTQVSYNETANRFVYFKTLERNNGTTATTIADANGRCEYTTIPNPFSKRPVNAPTSRTMYLNWTRSNNSNSGTITINYTNAFGSSQTFTQTINGTGSTTLTMKVGTTFSYTVTCTASSTSRYNTFSVRYDGTSGTQIVNQRVYGTNNSTSGTSEAIAAPSLGDSDWRGFYKWRIKTLSNITIYSSENDNGTYSAGDIVDAETKLYFLPGNGTGAKTVEFEAVWARAYVVANRASYMDNDGYLNSNTFSSNVSYERNFYILSGNYNTDNAINRNGQKPVTISSRYPNGEAAANTGNIQNNFTANADTKFEYVTFNAGSSTFIANNHDLIVGRGCSGTVNVVRGINGDVTSPNYTLRLESGTYNNVSILRGYGANNANGGSTDGGNNLSGTPSVKAVFGCDYDRATNNGITNNLIVTYNIYYASGVTDNNTTYSENALNAYIKSGKLGNGITINNNHTAAAQYTIYMGAAANRLPGHRKVFVEGGELSSLAGGIDGKGNENNNSLTLRMTGGHVRGAIYGGGARSAGYGSRKFIITGGDIVGWVGGGCNGEAMPANGDEDTYGGITYGSSKVYFGGTAACGGTGSNIVINGSIGGTVFGAGKGVEGNTTSGRMAQGTTVVIADECDIERNVYGGGNFGYAQTSTDVYVSGGTVHGSVFGGSNQNNGPVIGITMKGGTIEGGLYGGCNTSGTIGTTQSPANVNMNISGGTVEGGVYGGGFGTTSNSCDVTGTVGITMTGGTVLTGLYGGGNVNSKINGAVTVNVNGGTIGSTSATANVHGGGLGNLTRTLNSVTVNVGTSSATSGATIYGDVYGGSAEGKTNGQNGRLNNAVTNVTLNKGVINGSLYGGGRGSNAYAADVYGPVAVKVYGGSVKKTDANGANGSGGVYGANNISGSPQQSVTVDIYGTDPAPSTNEYALYAVYGGGNQADYTYTTANDTYPKVTIHNCDNSIEYVYGGGNAAAVAATDVTIWGGNKIGNVFGGGNGTVTAANVNGNAVTKIYGGTIGKVFGGSNSQGSISGSISVTVEKQNGDTDPDGSTDACDMHIDEVYGGGNMAASNAGSITIGCTGDQGEGIGDLYGGANAANITGDIALSITGGSIERVFGGNNASGTISGGIQVDVNWATTNPCGYNHLGSVFGGGNQAAYGDANDNKGNYPVVNIKNGTVTNNVFGGGLGATAIVYGNPQVTIGDNTSGHEAYVATVGGDVYGGGDAAAVVGTPVVNVVNKCNTSITNVYGGGNAADVNGTDVNIDGGNITGMVFGGGHGDKNANPQKAANVNGSVAVDVTGGTINKVFGGSNSMGTISGSVAVKIAKGTNSCDMHITEVYGGGNEAAGNAGTITIECTGDYENNGEGITTVFGGANAANVGNSINLTIRGGHIDNVYGGNNASGSISGSVTVTVNWDDALTCDKYLGNVFGGGNLAALSGAATVNIQKGIVSHNVYGGGNQAGVGSATVNMTGGSVLEGLYGGCNTSGTVAGAVSVSLTGGTIGTSSNRADVFGGGLGSATATSGDIDVTLNGTTVYGDIYGGSALGKVNSPAADPANLTTVTITGTNLHGSVFGGGKGDANTQAVSYGNATVNIYAANAYTGIYGGANVNGLVSGNIQLNINANIGASGDGNSLDVFGGGYGAATQTGGDVIVNVGNGSNNPAIYGAVYGGSALGSVNDTAADNTIVNIVSGTINGNIYGGGLGEAGVSNVAKGQVNGTVTVNIGAVDNSGSTPTYTGNATINGSVYGCNNTNGSPKANVTVNVYKTAHDTKNAATYTGNDATYAIDQVFGGGNQADYTPTATTSRATVNIYTCDNTIRRVFGGGNAAAAYGVVTIIAGGRFDWVFGGGNGEDTAANIGAGGTNLTVNAGVINHLFGGSNEQGTISGPMGVVVNNIGCTENIKEFFGGGNLAVIGTEGNPVNLTTTIACGTVFGAVYGGSNLADIYGNVTLNINGGTIGEVYAGSKGVAVGDATYTGGKAANIYGNTTLNINAGAIGSAFGGSNINGNITGSITVNMDWSQSDCSEKSITDVFGASNLATYTPTTPGSYPVVNIIHGTVSGNVFGAGNGVAGDPDKGVVTSNPVVTIGDANANHTAIVRGNVYGGGNNAGVTGNTTVTYNDNNASSTVAKLFGGGNAAGVSGTSTVTLTNGKVAGGVYGGCNASGSVGAVTVALNGGTVGATNATADVYGGGYGANTTTTDNITVTLGNTTVYGDIYGGSALGKVNSPAADPANLTTVTITGTNLHGSVFGGGKGDANTQAVSYGNATVNIYAANAYTGIYGGANVNGLVSGNIQLNINANIGASGDGNSLDVFGGGYGAATSTGGDVTVNVGNGSNNPAIYGAVYGGSALGSVNDAEADNTVVNVLSGTVNGNIYGGGLGEAGAANVAKGQVNGTVTVNIGATDGAQTPTYSGSATINGSVYGCNNTNGSPKGNVTVNIYQTAHDTKNAASYTGNDATYAIANVFGGGNLADYSPASDKTATVHVYTCNNTIGRVFGGGNAAAALSVATIIDGGRFEYVYGGGNGEVDPADIGTGGTNLQVHGGNIAYLFGGSNHSGTIMGPMRVQVDAEGDCGTDMYIAEFFCGNNEAPINTDITAVIGCGAKFGDVYGGCNMADITGNVSLTIEGGEMNNVYGGSKGSSSKAADIDGNVELNIFGGKIVQDAFGGSNINGNITGTITVNMDWSQASSGCNTDLHVTNVFGASNLATYTPTTPGSYPEVNIIHGTVSGSVFGGGNGDPNDATKGVVTSNPVVTIGDAVAGHSAVVTGNVYGGGNNAAVTGNTTVTYNDNNASSTVANLFGGGNAAGVSGMATVTLTSGKVLTGIYGGCNASGTVSGAIALNINGGQVGTDATHKAYGIFGGGKGSATRTGDAVTVTIGNDANLTPTIYGDVYGGSAEGQVNDALAETTKVWLKKGVINGDLYGGGFGDNGSNAFVNGNVQVVVDGGTVIGKVFGANNANGTPKGTVTVTINGTDTPQSGYALSEVYGGGNMADYDPTNVTPAIVVVNGCNNSIGVVYGGGNAADVLGTDVTIWGGTIGQVFGGGHGNKDANPATEANVVKRGNDGGNVAVKIYGGSITEVFGGSNSKGTIQGESTVTIQENGGTCGFNITDVYGGGNQAEGNAGTLSIGCGAIITGNVYGGAKAANVNNDIHLVITGGTLHNVFGGNNVSGTIAGTITVDINQDNTCTSWHVDNVFGCGDVADYSGTSTVNIINGTVSQSVYGGGNEADAGISIVNMQGGTVLGGIYGGCNTEGTVTGDITVNVTGGTMGSTTTKANVHGGGFGSATATSGNVTVNIGTISGTTMSGTAVIYGDVYGGSALGNVNSDTNDYTHVNLYAGTIHGDAYGGGLGRQASSGVSAVAANVYGNVKVTQDGVAFVKATTTDDENNTVVTAGRIFGCNNLNGSPQGTVLVLVNKTTPVPPATSHVPGTYEMAAVYGGGNLAAYNPAAATNITGQYTTNHTAANKPVQVVIDGCDKVSIEYVYGGGNAAPTPSTDVVVLGAFELGNVFGGGNGKDKYTLDGGTTWNANKGADVGLKPLETGGTPYAGDNTKQTYGTGESTVTITGGTIHGAFGGSNTLGDVVTNATVNLNEDGICELKVDEVYGGGNEAIMHGGGNIVLGCITYLQEIYGGAKQADVGNSVSLTITSGHFDRVFGGNNLGGTINGSITVNIEETGCKPITIGELYGCGNNAAYTTPSGYAQPTINIKSFTSIGRVFGGGLGAGATVTGSPIININEVIGEKASATTSKAGTTVTLSDGSTVTLPAHTAGEMGSIGTVFGGGNAANVVGDTYVNIGTASTIDYVSIVEGETAARTGMAVKGANITGNVYGGGNAADVTGKTNVTIGQP